MRNGITKAFANIKDAIEWRMALLRGSEGICRYFRKRGARIGEGCHILTGKDGMSDPHLVSLGNHVTLSAGSRLITHDGARRVLGPSYKTLGRLAPITIKDNCFIGAAAIVLQGRTIGPHSIVGAGAVVTKDVPPKTIVAGVPARIIKTLNEYEKSCLADPLFREWHSRSEQVDFFFGDDDKSH